MEKEIIVYEKLRKQVILIENFVSKVIFFDSILIENEYNQKKSFDLLGVKKEYDFLLDEDNVLKERVHIPDKLYGLYFVYRAVLLRVYYLYHKGKKQGNIVKFSNDKGIKQHLKTTFSDRIIEKIFDMKFGSLSKIKELLQNMILKEIDTLKSKENIVQVGGDFIVGNNNKNYTNNGNSHISLSTKKSWQNNIALFIIISVVAIVLGGIILDHILSKENSISIENNIQQLSPIDLENQKHWQDNEAKIGTFFLHWNHEEYTGARYNIGESISPKFTNENMKEFWKNMTEYFEIKDVQKRGVIHNDELYVYTKHDVKLYYGYKGSDFIESLFLIVGVKTEDLKQRHITQIKCESSSPGPLCIEYGL